jgi:enterobacterial common antigen flippase
MAVVTAIASTPPRLADGPQAGKASYGMVLKSSALIGGSSVLSIGLGIVRSKAMALLLGPAGIGLFGLYSSIAELTRSMAGLGLNSSGVREIAEAVGTGDDVRIARTVTALRRIALYSGAVGAILLLVFRSEVSKMTFGDDSHRTSIALLALAVFFSDISAAQGALVQGMRRIADLAKINVLGALYGTIFSIPIVYFWGEQGLVPSLVFVAAMSILTSWWYARKVRVKRVVMSLRETLRESSALVKLGVLFMASGLMALGTGYLVRIIILRRLGADDAGYYQAAWALGGLYIGFVLQAMGADFYPRLTALAGNDAECNRLVNEQAEVGLLIAGPGVLGTLAFAPIVIDVFYSGRFAPAVEVLRWISLGMVLRVGSWPIGYIVLAKGERKLFFWSEFLSYAALIILTWLAVMRFGVKGAGIAFAAMYLLNLTGVYLVVRRLCGFRWSAANRRLALLFLPVVLVVFLSRYYLPGWLASTVGASATILMSLYSLKVLCSLVPFQRLPPLVQRMLKLTRLSEGLPRET